MNSLTNISQNIFTAGIFTIVGAISTVSIFAALKADANGCHLSPDNAGCEMTRPIDIERNKEIVQYQPGIWIEESKTF
jgi:hypothetical protein